MSAGFDDRVEARLIGLHMASDRLTSGTTDSSNDTSSLPVDDKRISFSDQSTSSSMYTSQSSNGSYGGNSQVTARRFVRIESTPSLHVKPHSCRSQLPDHALSLAEQVSRNVYHQFVQNNLIIKQGLLDKKKVSPSRSLTAISF